MICYGSGAELRVAQLREGRSVLADDGETEVRIALEKLQGIDGGGRIVKCHIGTYNLDRKREDIANLSFLSADGIEALNQHCCAEGADSDQDQFATKVHGETSS